MQARFNPVYLRVLREHHQFNMFRLVKVLVKCLLIR